MNYSMLKQPSAFIPISMSCVALLLVVGHFLMFGVIREPDEGAAAHIFQILMVGQIPVIAFFIYRWLLKSIKNALVVISLQVIAALFAFAAVYFLT